MDELRISWLPMLLDAFAVADTGVSIVIRDTGKKSGKNLACREGCSECCRQPDIPLYPHEVAGIFWYAAEKLPEQARAALESRLIAHGPGKPCPFLADDRCLVHPVRPVACRQYNVFSRPCAPGEDPYFTRREDVLTPREEYTDRSFTAVLDFYSLDAGKDASASVKRVRSQVMNLQAYDWTELAQRLRTDGSHGHR